MRNLRNILIRRIILDIWTLLFILALCFSFINTARAQAIASDSCDPNYYDSLASRAWLEAQREITQNQNLIFKPDSVLEYSCFAQNIRQIVNNKDQLFSGGAASDRFDALDDVVDLPRALGYIVINPMVSYLDTNFDHNYLGGRSEYEREEIGDGKDYLSSGDEFDCDIMNRVWEEAKCMDFFADKDHDGFYTFEEYASSDDHRFYPTQCEAIQEQWEENIALATVDEETPWIEETMVTHMEDFFPEICAQSTPIATGLSVVTNNGDEWNEYVCVTPGCHYVHTGMDAGYCSQ